MKPQTHAEDLPLGEIFTHLPTMLKVRTFGRERYSTGKVMYYWVSTVVGGEKFKAVKIDLK